jgi:hypothetical protein
MLKLLNANLKSRNLRRRLAITACTGIAALMLASPVSAQYTFDPNNADEQQPGYKFFGSAKDVRGALMPGVSFVIEHAYTLVTDGQGRFRGIVPDTFAINTASVGCAKPGFTVVRVTKRPGPPGLKKQTLQVDCVLQAAK